MVLALVLFSCGAPVAAADLKIDAPYAGNKAKLADVQNDLLAAGYAIGKADGNFTAKSQAAYLSFLNQYANNLPPELDDATALRLKHVAAMLSTSPFDTPPADYGVLKPGATITWDGRNEKTPCPIAKCALDYQLLAVGDLTGDGLPELVYGTYPIGDKGQSINVPAPILIFTRAPDGSYHILPVRTDDPSGFVARVHARSAVIRDFNGDGVGDLFIAAHGYDFAPFPGEQNVLLLSSPDGLVDASRTSLPIQNDFAHGVDAADLDGDGDIDMIVITNGGASKVEPYVLWNDGKGKFTQARLDTILDRDLALFLTPGMKSQSKYISVTIADVDKDGNLDLVLCRSGDDPGQTAKYPGLKYTRIVYGDGTGKWTSKRVTELPTNRWGYNTYTTDAKVLDIDGDGDNDIVLSLAKSTQINGSTQWGDQYIQVLRNENGTFVDDTGESMFSQRFGGTGQGRSYPVRLSMADINGDGSPDIVINNRDPWKWNRDRSDWNAVMIALNDGKGHFTRVDPAQWHAEEDTGTYLDTGDFDGDGDIDLVGTTDISDRQASVWHPYGFVATIYDNTGITQNPPLSFRKPGGTITREALSPSGADNTFANALLETSFHDKSGKTVLYQYAIKGNYLPAISDFTQLYLVPNVSVDPAVQHALAACKTDMRTDRWNDQEHPVLYFEKVGHDWKAQDIDCVAAALPKPLGDEIEYLGTNLETILTDMQASGNADGITNKGLRRWISRVAAGEFNIASR